MIPPQCRTRYCPTKRPDARRAGYLLRRSGMRCGFLDCEPPRCRRRFGRQRNRNFEDAVCECDLDVFERYTLGHWHGTKEGAELARAPIRVLMLGVHLVWPRAADRELAVTHLNRHVFLRQPGKVHSGDQLTAPHEQVEVGRQGGRSQTPRVLNGGQPKSSTFSSSS